MENNGANENGQQQQNGGGQKKDDGNPLNAIFDFLQNPTVLTLGLAATGIFAFMEHQKKGTLEKELDALKEKYGELYAHHKSTTLS